MADCGKCFSFFSIFFCFDVAICDLVHDNSCEQHLKIFTEILVMPGRLQIAVSQALLIFKKKRFPDAVIAGILPGNEGEI